MAYVIDDGCIWKGIIDSRAKGKGSKVMIKFQGYFYLDTGKPKAHRYDKSELYPNRKAAQRALACLESTSESDGPSDERRGYQRTKALKDAERKTRAANRSALR